MSGEDSDIGGAPVISVDPDIGGANSGGDSAVRGGGSVVPGSGSTSGGNSRTGGIFGRDRGRAGSVAKPTAKAQAPVLGGADRATVEPELKQAGPPKKPEAVKRPKLDLQTFANVVTVGVFNSVAIATAHEHWLKTHEEILDFTVPLVEWANQLPPKTIKKLENNLAPMLTIVGLYSILAPDIAEEIRIRNEDRRRINAEAAASGQGTNKASVGRSLLDRARGGKPEPIEPAPTVPNDFARSKINDNYNV